MSPLAQRILNAYDARDRDQLQRAVTEVDKMVLRQSLPDMRAPRCTCGQGVRDAIEHDRSCPIYPWTR
jgi:hypothetical protein